MAWEPGGLERDSREGKRLAKPASQAYDQPV